MEQVAWAMEYFTIAHEYGHHVLGHRSVDADPIEQEYEADRLALRVCHGLEIEPLYTVRNPYLRTGAGATLMIKGLAILRSIDDRAVLAKTVDTHPTTESRIERIMNQNVLQPTQFRMDHEFNGVVLRIMNAVEHVVADLVRQDMKEIIVKMKRLTGGR